MTSIILASAFMLGTITAFGIFMLSQWLGSRKAANDAAYEAAKRKTYKYETPFDDKLIELGVKELWDSNYSDSGYYIFSFKKFISSSFVWASTPEGHNFWHEISLK